jgi:hypothetical protein
MNTSKKSAQVLILNDLQETLSPLESALAKKGGGGWGQQRGPEAFAPEPSEFCVIATRLQLRIEEETQRKGEQGQRLDEY